jgi:Tfp pilus assembly protein PilF
LTGIKGIFYVLYKIPFLIILCPSLLLSTISYSQSSKDTLEMVRQYRDHGKIKTANSLVKAYYLHHSEDFNTTWLYAQVAYYSHHIRNSISLYEKAIKLSPKNLYLQLDYGKMLVNITEYEKAKKILKKYLTYDPTNSQAWGSLAKISFWQADYNKALAELKRIKQSELKSEEMTSFIQDIQIAKSPWISLKEGYLNDDQPLQSFTSQMEGGIFLHPMSLFHFFFQVPVFIKQDKTSQSYWFQVGNKSVAGKAKMEIEADLGILKFPSKNSLTWTGNLELDKIFFRHLLISIQAERIPYFYTLSSIDTVVIDHHGSVTIGWNDLKSWNGEASLDIHQYPLDHNYLYSFSSWIFAPPVKFSFVELRFGYGYNYSTSQKNHFVSVKSLPEILENYDPAEQIKGIYNPYFTPKEQSIHSALLGINVSPGKVVKLNVNGNFGVYAIAQIPYLYLDKNNQAETIISRDFVNKNFFPVQVNAAATFQVSKTTRIQVEYAYNKTYYFNSHYAGIGLKINFWHSRNEN